MTIGEFMLYLAGNPDALSSFSSGPEGAEAAMREAELDEHLIQLLLTADLSTLRAKIVAEFRVDGVKVAIETVCLVRIGRNPDPTQSPSSDEPAAE